MKRDIRNIVSVAIALLAVFAAAFAQGKPEEKPIRATVADILKEPSKFDGKVVQVSAEIRTFAQRTSRAGNKYFTFKLREGEGEINGYGRGELAHAFKDGAMVEVVGIYRTEKKLGDLVFKNEVDCTIAEGKPYGIKELKKPG